MNGQPGTVYPDSSFDVAAVPVTPGTNILTATYTGPAYTNVPMTATDTSTIVLGDTAYTHDANGNLTSDATFTYQYDLANQLTNVIRKADSVSVLQCRYDALGRRVEAIRSDGTVDRYVYFPGSFLVLAVLDETNAPQRTLHPRPRPERHVGLRRRYWRHPRLHLLHRPRPLPPRRYGQHHRRKGAVPQME